MNVPEHIKKLIVENFFDSRLTISTLLKMINKEYKMDIEELYEFLQEYQDQTGIRKYRLSSNTSEKLKNDIFEKRLLGMPYYKIANTLREESVVKISPSKVKEICEEVFAEKKVKEPKTYYRTGIFAIVRDNTIESFKNNGMKPEEIEEYFKKLGVDLNNPYKYDNIEKYGVYEMGNDFIYDYIYVAKKERRSYRRIVKELAEKGIETSYETIRKNSKRIFEERKEIEPKVLPKVQHKKKPKPNIPGVYELRKQHLTYKEIQDIINEQSDKTISYETIRKVCKNDFEERNEIEPKILYSYSLEGDAVNEQIYNLRKHGVTYKEIADILNSQGFKIEKWTVAYRCKRIFALKDEENKPETKTGQKIKADAIDNEKLINMVYKVTKDKNASKEQLNKFIKEISRIYNTDLEVKNEDKER